MIPTSCSSFNLLIPLFLYSFSCVCLVFLHECRNKVLKSEVLLLPVSYMGGPSLDDSEHYMMTLLLVEDKAIVPSLTMEHWLLSSICKPTIRWLGSSNLEIIRAWPLRCGGNQMILRLNIRASPLPLLIVFKR